MKYWFWIVILIIIFILPGQIVAASINLACNQSDITSDQELTTILVLSINSPDNTKYYLRGVYFRPGTTNYCGYTWNGSTWYSGPYSSAEGWKNFLPVSIQNSSWSGELKTKIDSHDSGCNVSGEYHLKVERFTESGSGTYDNQNDLSLMIIIPTPTPTLIPPSPVPTIIFAIPSVTMTPSPRIIPTLSPTMKITNSAIPTQIPSSTSVKSTTQPAAVEIYISETPSIFQTPVISSDAGLLSNFTESVTSPGSVLGIQSKIDNQINDNNVNTFVSMQKTLIISCGLVGIGLAILTGVTSWKVHQKIKFDRKKD